MRGRIPRILFLIFLCIPMATFVSAQSPYPTIEHLSQDDPLFRQVSYDIASWYQYEKQGSGYLPPLALYSYTIGDESTLFDIASRMNLPYETLALLNDIEHPEDFSSKRVLLIPNRPGLFIPRRPQTELERIMAGWRDVSEAYAFTVRRSGTPREYFFLPGEGFHPVERAYFLGVLFRLPLAAGVITSRFGTRVSPITGMIHHHNGIDIAAPRGSEVYAARDGTVTEVGNDGVYGLFVVISHSDGYQTLYGHLDARTVELNQRVYSGMIVGAVGSSGLSTGPHLHFEIRRKGEARDPYPLMPLF